MPFLYLYRGFRLNDKMTKLITMKLMSRQDKTGTKEMKVTRLKSIGIMLCIVASAIMSSCSPDENADATNPLVGTKWTCKYASSNMVLEFLSSTEVQAYFANSALVYERGLTSGTYSLSGKNITFDGLDIVYTAYGSSKSHYVPQTGTYSGSIMQTKGRQSIYSDNDWMDWNETWNKQ